MRYVRVRLVRKTMYLRVVTETATFLVGIEVTRDGDEVSGMAFDQRKHFIHKSAITRQTEMVMDPTYATLVEGEARG